MTKLCLQCGNTFHRRKRGESDATWAKRKFCSRSCFAEYRVAQTVTRACEHCGKPLVFRSSQPKERRRDFAKRRYCDLECRDAANGSALAKCDKRPAAEKTTIDSEDLRRMPPELRRLVRADLERRRAA